MIGQNAFNSLPLLIFGLFSEPADAGRVFSFFLSVFSRLHSNRLHISLRFENTFCGVFCVLRSVLPRTWLSIILKMYPKTVNRCLTYATRHYEIRQIEHSVQYTARTHTHSIWKSKQKLKTKSRRRRRCCGSVAFPFTNSTHISMCAKCDCGQFTLHSLSATSDWRRHLFAASVCLRGRIYDFLFNKKWFSLSHRHRSLLVWCRWRDSIFNVYAAWKI